MELIHSAFLIHDDIMDRDQLRRGSETLYYQYQKWGESNHLNDAYSFGQAMGICAGDEAFFLAYELLTDLPLELPAIRRIIARVTLEMKRVGVAQMQDVAFGYCKNDPSLDDILSVYRYKTAFYTFSLPLHIASVLAGQSDQEISKLESIGEALGIIFQLKDDDIGLFGAEATIGKPTGSDIREDKKTVFRYYMKKMICGPERTEMDGIFGNAALGVDEVQWIRDLSIQRGVRKQVSHLIGQYEKAVRKDVQSLKEMEKLKPMILALLDYSLERTF